MFNFKSVILKELLYSIIYNIIFFTIYYFLIINFPNKSTYISFFFLLAYLFILIPFRDYTYSLLFIRKRKKSMPNIDVIENRIHQIINFKDIFQFLSEYVKEWKISGLRVVLYKPYPRIMYYNSNGHRKWISMKKPEPYDFLNFLKENPQIHNRKEFSDFHKNYLYNIKIAEIFPIMLRNNIIGTIGTKDELDERSVKITEKIARRLALVSENEQLQKEINRAQFLEKEFSLAKRVENLLERKEDIKRCGYIVSKIDKGWEDKYFPALFEVNQNSYPDDFFNFQRSSSLDPECPYYIMLVRLSNQSHRSRTMQLFSVQGYFLSLAKSSRNLRSLAKRLNSTLKQLENSKIQLDGFLLQFYKKGIWDILPFGKNLQIYRNNQWENIPRSAPMGSERFIDKILFRIEYPKLIQLSISNYELLWINKKIA